MSSTRGQDRCDGSTLFELLVVLAIMTLMIAAAMPLLSHSAPGRELRMRAQEIAALMRHARTLAIRDNREVGVATDVKRRRIELAGVGEPVDLPESVAIRVLTARGLIVEDAASIVFTPGGGSTGGSIALSDGKITATIAVTWLSADVRTSVENVR
jgi:general secretion pathway protein H